MEAEETIITGTSATELNDYSQMKANIALDLPHPGQHTEPLSLGAMCKKWHVGINKFTATPGQLH